MCVAPNNLYRDILEPEKIYDVSVAMETLPLPFSSKFTLFCEGAESEHQRTMKKNNNMAEGEYEYLFLAVRVEVGSQGSVDQMCLMDANTGKTKIFEYDLRKSSRSLLCDNFDAVVGLGSPKVIICHNLPEVLPVLRKARLSFDNVAGFASLQWCLPLEDIKVESMSLIRSITYCSSI